MLKQAVFVQNKIDARDIQFTVNERGDDLMIIPSYTLPDDCVMNRIFYPAEKIATSYPTLEGTLAPIGHPVTESGEYISATDAEAIDYFHAGIVNRNVRRVKDAKFGHRVFLEKHLNVKVASQTERGLAAIAAINEGKPIHSSTGLLLEIENTPGVHNGKEYDGIARNIIADHDALLFDEEGAATPDDGVGLLVNRKLVDRVSHHGRTMAVNTYKMGTDMPKPNQSMRDKERLIQAAIQELMPSKEWKWLADWGDDYAIIEAEDENYRVSYASDSDGNVTISGDPEPVRRVTMWEAVQNAAKKLFNRGTATQPNQEDSDMSYKERIEAALDKADIDHANMDEEEKMNAFEKTLKGNAAEGTENPQGEQSRPTGEAVLNAETESLIDQKVEARFNALREAEEADKKTNLVEQLKANGVEVEDAEVKTMSVNALQKWVDSTTQNGAGHGLPGGQMNVNHGESRFSPDLVE